MYEIENDEEHYQHSYRDQHVAVGRTAIKALNRVTQHQKWSSTREQQDGAVDRRWHQQQVGGDSPGRECEDYSPWKRESELPESVRQFLRRCSLPVNRVHHDEQRGCEQDPRAKPRKSDHELTGRLDRNSRHEPDVIDASQKCG